MSSITAAGTPGCLPPNASAVLYLDDQCALLTCPGACACPTLVNLSSRYIPRLIATASFRSRHHCPAVRCRRSPADAITACSGARPGSILTTCRPSASNA